jgi:hypothetical protein
MVTPKADDLVAMQEIEAEIYRSNQPAYNPAYSGMGDDEAMSMPGATAGINVSQVITSVLKYLIEGLAIAIVAYAVPQKKLKLNEVATIALVGGATFAILDMYAPGATADAARMGAGFGIGGNLVGFA